MIRRYRLLIVISLSLSFLGLAQTSRADALEDCKDAFDAAKCPASLQTYFCDAWIAGDTSGIKAAVTADFVRISHRNGLALKEVGSVKQGVSYSPKDPPPNNGPDALVAQLEQALALVPTRTLVIDEASCPSTTAGEHTVRWSATSTADEKDVIYPCSTDDPGCRVKCQAGPGTCKPILIHSAPATLSFSGKDKVTTDDAGKIVKDEGVTGL